MVYMWCTKIFVNFHCLYAWDIAQNSLKGIGSVSFYLFFVLGNTNVPSALFNRMNVDGNQGISAPKMTKKSN